MVPKSAPAEMLRGALLPCLWKKADRIALSSQTLAGPLSASKVGDARISVDMGEPKLRWREIPLAEQMDDTRFIDIKLGPIDKPVLWGPSAVNVGNPHCIFFVEDAEAQAIDRFGPLVENHPLFPERANVSVAEVRSKHAIRLRVWERGVGITKACGTAACAAVVAAHRRRLSARKATVILDGGELAVEWRDDNRIMMTGPSCLRRRRRTTGYFLMAKLYFNYAAMNAGKSTTLLQASFNYRERGMNTFEFTAALDNRTTQGAIASRIGLKKGAYPFSQDTDLFAVVAERHRDNPIDCVFLDEAQFMSSAQAHQLAQIVDELDIPVICYGLRTDFRGELFEGSARLLAIADDIKELKTICHCGRKAIMNLRIDANGKAVTSGEKIEIGGNDRYTALCRKHFYDAFNN